MNEDTNLNNPQTAACFLPHVIGCLSFFNADNLEIMRGFKDKEFDLAIVDKINMILLLLYQSIFVSLYQIKNL